MTLIERSVAELKGEKWHEEIDPEINVDMPAYLPSDYVSDTDVRLNLYRRLSGLREESELSDMEEEVRDRFGPPPEEVSNLLNVVALRLHLKKIGVTRLDVSRQALVFSFSSAPDIKPERVVMLAQKRPERFRFLSDRKLKVRIESKSPLEALREAKGILYPSM